MIRAWHQKALKDGVKALLPFQPTLRRIKRSFFPYSTNRQNDEGLLQDVLAQIRSLRDYGADLGGKTVVEIGTGWFPLLPLLYRLCGANVITLDQEKLLDRHTIAEAAHFLTRRKDTIARSGVPVDWSILEGWESAAAHRDFLSGIGISYRAPADFRSLPAESADVIVSRDVLEHIPEAVLSDIFTHARRILKPTGIMCHTIDMSDHWEHADKSISRLNFLQYQGPLWDFAGFNPQNFQNRLRRSEYIAMFRACGFEVASASGEADPRALAALAGLKLCPRYAGFEANDLATLSTTVIARNTVAH